MALAQALAVTGMVPEYAPVARPEGLTPMVMMFPVVVAVIHDCVGVPARISGLDVDLVLSLPTTLTVWFAGAVALLDEKVAKAGLPSSTGTFAGVTRRLTPTLVTPLGVVMLT